MPQMSELFPQKSVMLAEKSKKLTPTYYYR